MIHSVNPYNGEKLESFEPFDESRIAASIESAQQAFNHWKSVSHEERAALMRRVAEELKANVNTYASTITAEMGKPIEQSRAEVEKCAWVCEYYADNAASHLEPEIIETDADRSFVRYEPLGVILAVMPWNFPFWQVFRFAVPSLMAGNTALLKHASNVMQSARHIEEIFNKAGFPAACFQSLVISSDQVERVIKDPLVKAVSLTGSTPAGSSVAESAGKLIKKSVLELGGSNALIVFEDADLDKAIEVCVQARFQNTGQSCIAGKRLLVQESVSELFMEKFIKAVKELKAGDPMEEETYIGVLAREDLAEDLEEQLKESVDKGAKIVLGGGRKGTFFEPTIVDGVKPEMPVFNEETFGPLIGITRFKDEAEAVELSNNSKFGLGVSIFTSDKNRAERLIPAMEEGAVFINELVKSDPRLPFGGIKTSGYGRELSKHGILEFVNRKTVYIKAVQ